jgi:hypothetical protein
VLFVVLSGATLVEAQESTSGSRIDFGFYAGIATARPT